MSLLFTPKKIGAVEIRNRFVRAATYEGMADAEGRVTDALASWYGRLAKGEAGLVLSSFMYVHPLGRALRGQMGIESDKAVPGLARLADAVHGGGGKIAFELTHGGRQAKPDLIGGKPLGPSAVHRDPSFFVKPAAMTASDIREAIASFLAAARRSVEAGGDIVYVHAGGGDLLNQFLSPYFNCRGDEWGGSPANRFRIVSEIVQGIKAAHPGVPVLVKMNAMDFTPGPGVTPELAVEYAAMLAGIGVDALELTSGVKFYNFMRCWRGGVPVREILDALPGWKRPVAYLKFKLWALQYGLVEGWNLDYLRAVRPVTGPMALLLVGGVRTSAFMEQVLARGEADFVCLSRPFIREPNLVKKIREGAPAVSCTSCNLCFARAAAEQPVRCSNAGAG